MINKKKYKSYALLFFRRSLSVVILLFCVSASASENSDRTTILNILESIKSPFDLLKKEMPRRYFVPVSISGSIADKMNSALHEMKVEKPEYLEIYSEKEKFNLVLTNNNYSSDMREMISGILNPVEMTEIILNSILQYKDRAKLNDIFKKADIQIRDTLFNNKQMVYIKASPLGNRFSYKYNDRGSFIRESWLTSLSILLDHEKGIARKLDFVKHSRTYTLKTPARPESKKSDFSYTFDYIELNKTEIPSSLVLFIDSKKALSVRAEYKKIKNKILFKSKKVCYYNSGKKEECLTMEYGRYEFGRPDLKVRKIGNNTKNRRKLERAAQLSLKATRALSEGEIEKAGAILDRIAKYYPDTPQGIEAKRLLEGLPGYN